MSQTNNFAFLETPGTVYVVGGAVRDELLDTPVKDHDWVVVGATPQDMLAAGYQQVGADFPVFLHPDTKEEYALARTERKQGSGYHGFICDFDSSVTLEQDLERRDLTINAMARASDGRLIDPYGGQTDLKARVLRHVSPAFMEDPLRVLRVARFSARFAAFGFSIAPETLKQMCAMVEAGELQDLTPERVWQETNRALGEKDPCSYIKVLRACGALKALMPELDALFGVPQPETYHPEIDCGAHALLSLEAACKLSDSTSVRFAALIHDLGKALTPSTKWPKHHGHELSGLKPIKALCERIRASNYDKKLSLLACQYHTHIHRAFELKAETVLKVIKACDALRKPALFEDVLLVCIADARGRTGFENAPYPQADYFREALNIARHIDVKALVQSGLKGKDLGDAIDARRVEELRKLKASVQD